MEASATEQKETKKQKGPRGMVFVEPEICKGCLFCIEFCPTDVLELSTEFNSKGYHYPVVAKPEACSGCDMCGLYCPDFAVFALTFKEIEALRKK